MKKINLMIVFMILSTLVASPAQAHMLWLNVENYVPEVGKPVHIQIGWGHKFPKDEVIKEGLLKRIYALDQQKKEISLKQRALAEFDFIPEKDGVYSVLASIHPGFLTKTVEGYKLQSKEGLKDAVSCFNFDMRAKAVLNISETKKGFDMIASDPLEIVPLKDPSRLKKADVLPLKVFFGGKLLTNVNLSATFEGFSDGKDLSIITDNEGVGQLKLTEKGRWLVTVVHEIPYPDSRICDKYRYTYSLSFDVK